MVLGSGAGCNERSTLKECVSVNPGVSIVPVSLCTSLAVEDSAFCPRNRGLLPLSTSVRVVVDC